MSLGLTFVRSALAQTMTNGTSLGARRRSAPEAVRRHSVRLRAAKIDTELQNNT